MSRQIDKTTGLRSDQTIMLAGVESSRLHPDPLRRVSYYDAENDRRFVFLTNSFTIPALTVAGLYKSRWQVETYFKLLKSHGLQLEDWLQATGPAIARRLLVASMACVTVWHLLADDSAPATELKNVLIRLSGRQMKRQTPHTAPTLFGRSVDAAGNVRRPRNPRPQCPQIAGHSSPTPHPAAQDRIAQDRAFV